MANDLYIFNHEKTIDFIATVCADFSPHITVFNSVMQKDDQTLMFGQYCQGISKDNIMHRPKAAILAIDPEQNIAGGLVNWIGRKNTGAEHEMFNNIPRFRYNAVYGYAYIHLLDIVEFGAIKSPSPEAVEESICRTEKAIYEHVSNSRESALTHIGELLFPALPGFKVLSYIGDNGYPHIMYVPQAAVQERSRVVFSMDLYPDMYAQIPEGAMTAVLSLIPQLGAAILVKGTYNRLIHRGEGVGIVDIKCVYNPNVPASGYIYPMPELKTVRTYKGAGDVR